MVISNCLFIILTNGGLDVSLLEGLDVDVALHMLRRHHRPKNKSYLLSSIFHFPFFLNTNGVPYTIEHWIIHRGQGFLAVVWFVSSPSPSPPHQEARPATLRKRDSLLMREGEGGGQGAESYDRKEALSSKTFNTLWRTLYCLQIQLCSLIRTTSR